MQNLKSTQHIKKKKKKQAVVIAIVIYGTVGLELGIYDGSFRSAVLDRKLEQNYLGTW